MLRWQFQECHHRLGLVGNLGKFFAYPNYNLKELRSRTHVPDAENDRVVQLEDKAYGKQPVQH